MRKEAQTHGYVLPIMLSLYTFRADETLQQSWRNLKLEIYLGSIPKNEFRSEWYAARMAQVHPELYQEI
jgi:hypothetical protein